MQSVLNALYRQKIENGDIMKCNKEYKKLIDEACYIYKELDKSGTEEQKGLLDRLRMAEMGQEYEASLAYFKEGFKTCLFIFAEFFEN